MKPLTAMLAACCLAWNLCAANAVMHFDFEAPPGVPGKNLGSTDGNSFGRFRENTKTKQTAQIAADTPDALKSRSKSCAEVNRGLIWLKPNGKDPYEFAKGFTFNLWFKADAAPEKTVFFGSFNKSWRLGYTPSNQRFYFQNQATAEREYSTPIPFPAGAWHMLTVTGKDGEINFFLDGKAVGARQLKQPFAPSPELFLGNGAAFDDSCFDGRLDDVALYDAMLTVEDIAKLFSGAPVTVKRTAPASSVKRAPGTLERIKTEPFGADFKPYTVVRDLALVKDGKPAAVIVKPDAGAFAGLEGKVQDALEARWKVRFSVMDAAAALKSGMPMILFGRANSNMLLRRLDVNGCIEHTQKGYEVRVMPQVLDWPSGAVFIGGKDEAAMLKGVEVLTSKFADPAMLGFFIELEKYRDHQADPAAVKKMVDAMTEHYKNPPDYIPNQSAIRIFREPSTLFRRTGDPAYARALGDQLKIYLDNYDRAINARGTPPSFMLHEMPWLFALVESSPAFTDEDRARFAEVLRRAAEHCMDYWEMRDPMANYEAGKTVYNTNHPIFASRSVWFAGNYLLTHYRYQPAEYWMRVSENALAGIAPHPLGPEDSASYQFICYRLFITYAIGSGKYDAAFFNSKPFLNYIEYCKALISHLGSPAGYGDNPPLGNPGGFPILGYAVDLFADREAESLLALIGRAGNNPTYRSMIENMGVDLATPPAMKDSTVGLNVFLLDDFRMEERKTPEKNTDAIDKVYYRSSWQPDAGFLVLSGISAAPHGHQGANGISLYLRGSHYWLVEGDYIRLQPEEHNSIALRVNGEAVRPGEKSPDSLARLQFAGQLPDKSMALTVSQVPAYGKAVDWRRMIAWEKDAGFWVVDDLKAIASAEVVAENRFRALADAIEVNAQTVALTQKESQIANDPNRFFITEGTGAEQRFTSQFDAGHSGKDGYYLDQKLASPLTRVIKQRQAGSLKKGDSLRFANYLGHEPVTVRELGPGTYLALTAKADGPVRLALTGPWRGNGIEFDGESCFAGPRGLIAAKVKSLKAGGLDLKFEQPQDVKLAATELPPSFFAALRTAAEGVAPKTPLTPEIKTVELKTDKVELGSRITALAALPDGSFAAGTEKGLFRVLDAAGKTRFEHQLGSEITAVTGFAVNGTMRYFAAVAPEKIDGDARLVAFDPSGKELWSETFGLFQSRNGTIRTLFPARLDKDGALSLIVGNEGWHYFAYTPEGKLKWKRQIYHGATTGAAADLDGDGLDEIIAGAEYYYHQLLGSDGKVIFQKTTAPWNYAVAAVDLDGDGKKEALCGRSDGRIHLMTPLGGSKLAIDAIPAGGIPAGIVPFAANGGKFAAATADGRVVFGDGAGKIVKALDLNADLAGIAVRGDEIIAAGLDGRAYLVKADGSWRAVKLGAADPLRLPPPAPAATGSTAAVAVGDGLYLVH